MHFYEMSLAFQFSLLLNCCIFSTILLNYAKERNPFKHLYNIFLMKSKLLLSFLTAPDSSSIKLKWLGEFLHYVLHLHFRCSDFCSDSPFKVTSESVPTLFIPFSLLFKIDCKCGFLHTFSISSTGTKALLFFLRQTPAKQLEVTCKLCMLSSVKLLISQKMHFETVVFQYF